MRSFVILPSTALLACAIHAAGLNDTGQTTCYNSGNAPVACSTTVGGDAGVNPRQDARYGRDAQAAAGRLTKVGAGTAGFDFSKIANNGTTLSANAALGDAGTDWACTKDNITGLIWEVKPTFGLRNSAYTYTWYSTQPTNGGNPGGLGTDSTCGYSLGAPPYNNQCNTQNFVSAVNAATLCGAANWRLPTQKELLSIVSTGATNPSIDVTYFPNTVTDWHWTASTSAADPAYAWHVGFNWGRSFAPPKSNWYYVRLVRGGP